MPWPTNPSEEYFGRGLWGWAADTWRKLSLLWGYTDRWNEDLSCTADATGYVLVTSTAVPAGYVYVLEAVSMKLVERATTSASVGIKGSGVVVALAAAANLGANTYLFWVGRTTFKAGDQVELYLAGSQSGDTFTAALWGHKMAVT